MLEQTGLGGRADDELGTLSGGNRQRVNIAVGLLADPPVLALDEPSSSLDPRQRERLWEFIGALAGGGTTVLFSTHNVGEAERYAGRVLVLADGEVLFTGSPATSRHSSAATAGLRGRLRALPARARALDGPMRWLLLKDLQILRRSPSSWSC
jgi:ABC-type multidrug transport system ATPase subunit